MANRDNLPSRLGRSPDRHEGAGRFARSPARRRVRQNDAVSQDVHRLRRQQHLAGIVSRLRVLGIGSTFEALEPYYDFYGSTPDGLTGLVVRQLGDARMQVTVVRVRRILPLGEGGL